MKSALSWLRQARHARLEICEGCGMLRTAEQMTTVRHGTARSRWLRMCGFCLVGRWHEISRSAEEHAGRVREECDDERFPEYGRER